MMSNRNPDSTPLICPCGRKARSKHKLRTRFNKSLSCGGRAWKTERRTSLHRIGRNDLVLEHMPQQLTGARLQLEVKLR